MCIEGADQYWLDKADEYMISVDNRCPGCGKPIGEDGECWACQEFDKNED